LKTNKIPVLAASCVLSSSWRVDEKDEDGGADWIRNVRWRRWKREE